MNSKVLMVLRILLGVFVLVFGLNKFFHFIPFGEMPAEAGAYFAALSSAKVMTLVGIVEIVAGLGLIFNKYGALLSLILMSISVNALLFHLTLDPANSGGAIALFILNIIALYNYKDSYKALL